MREDEDTSQGLLLLLQDPARGDRGLNDGGDGEGPSHHDHTIRQLAELRVTPQPV